MGINIRSKGQNGEREIIKIIAPVVKKYWPAEEVGRNLDQTRDGGHDIVGVPGFSLEIKRGETLQLKQWWAQTVKQAVRIQARPVLLYRQNHRKWRAVVSLYEMLPTVVIPDYPYTIDMSMEGFLLWFEQRMAQDVDGCNKN